VPAAEAIRVQGRRLTRDDLAWLQALIEQHPDWHRTGFPNPDFPGLARFFRQLAVPAALHIHFTGAGGNLGAGKYNDGSPENRRLLAERLADGMRRAWESTQRQPISAADVSWTVRSVALPAAKHLAVAMLEAELKERLGRPGRPVPPLGSLGCAAAKPGMSST